MKRAHTPANWFVLGTMLCLLTGGTAFSKLNKWNKKMQELAKTFTELLPETLDSRPVTPETKKRLLAGAKKLMDLSHSINMGPGTKGNPLPPEADPTIGFVSHLFERETKHAYHAVEAGHIAYAKSSLRAMTGYCIACHTRNDRGPDFPLINLEPQVAKLSPMERAELLTATRRFDAALDEFTSIVADANGAIKRPFEWGHAMQNALAIAVRVKKDPVRALTILEQGAKNPQLPKFYADNMPTWRKTVIKWKDEQQNRLNTEEGLFMEATRLCKEARDSQEYALDHSADILYMRCSAVVHELLAQYPHGSRTSEAFLLAGTAYELLEDRLISPLPDLYYESCVRNSPHSDIAEKCYKRYEQNVYFGYSGSAGTFIPDDVQDLMKELRTLAQRAG